MTDRERSESLRQMANMHRANESRRKAGSPLAKTLPARYARAARLVETRPALACTTYAQAALQGMFD